MKILGTFALVGVGILMGLYVVPYLVPQVRAQDADIPSRTGVAPLARMSADMRNMCQQMDPLLRQIETALEDRTISPQEGVALYSHVRRLM